MTISWTKDYIGYGPFLDPTGILIMLPFCDRYLPQCPKVAYGYVRTCGFKNIKDLIPCWQYKNDLVKYFMQHFRNGLIINLINS